MDPYVQQTPAPQSGVYSGMDEFYRNYYSEYFNTL